VITEYNENLESFICNQFSGDFQRVLRSLINANREESNRVDQQISEKEAKALYEVKTNFLSYFEFVFILNMFKAGVKIMGTDEDDFLRILCNYSFDQLQDIFKHYNRLTGHTIETAIAKEFSGQLLDIFSAIGLTFLTKIQFLDFDLTKLFFSFKCQQCLHLLCCTSSRMHSWSRHR